MNQHAKIYGSKVSSFESFCPDTHTQTHTLTRTHTQTDRHTDARDYNTFCVV